jgi:hypothetical protein
MVVHVVAELVPLAVDHLISAPEAADRRRHQDQFMLSVTCTCSNDIIDELPATLMQAWGAGDSADSVVVRAGWHQTVLAS